MANIFDKAVGGAVGWWYGTSGDVATIQAADEKIRALNDAAGISNAQIDATAYTQERADAELADAARIGREEGQANVRAFVTDTAGSILQTTFGLVPWWVWPLAIVGAAVYFWPLIRGALNLRRGGA